MGVYGCKPGWTPDTALATREDDPVSREQQIEEERARWANDPENPEHVTEVDETAPADEDDLPEPSRYL